MSGGQPARKRSSQSIGGSRRPNTLGLRRKELEDVFAEIEAAAAAAGGAGAIGGTAPGPAKRTFVRRAFRHTTIPMQIYNRNGAASATIAVACRNLSRGGIAVLHSSYIHIGTRVFLALPHASGLHHVAARGEVVRCQHFRGVIHDIGIRFDDEINVRDMLGLDPFGDWFSLEQVDPAKLKGSLLVVDPSAEDVRLMRQHLRETSMGVSEAGRGGDALDALGMKRFDVIVCDHALPDMSGGEFAAALRERGDQTPMIITTAESSDEVRLRVAACPADAFLAKPVDKETLFRAVAEFVCQQAESEDAGSEGASPAAAPAGAADGGAEPDAGAAH